jgi:putative oxidoreductase
MGNFVTNFLTVVGRVALVAIFAGAAVQKMQNYNSVVGYADGFGVPQPKLAIVAAIVVLVAGSASVALGYRARLGAAMLLVFLALASYYFHPFWRMPSEQIAFMKNLSMAGAMIFIVANGSGPASLKRD